jgi:hypothetical protein
VNLGELGSTSVLLDIDETGLLFAGMTSTQIIPDLTNAEMSLQVQIPANDLLASSAELNGALTVAGLGLDPARMFISPLGFEVEGNLDLSPVATLMVLGEVNSSGVLLTGAFDASVSFNLQATVDDALSVFQDAVDLAQGLLDGCLDLCPGDCYLNPCCGACYATLWPPLEAAQLALDGAELAADLFFDGLLDILGISLSGTVTAHVDVTIDGFNASGAVSASLNGVSIGGSARFIPPQVCVTLPLASIPGADILGIGDADFCLP